MSNFAFQRTFAQDDDFAATRAAEAFLSSRGFSVGRMQARSPTGILFGNYDIQKWRNLRAADRDALHGLMLGAGRAGPVTVYIYDNCPPDGLKALGVDA